MQKSKVLTVVVAIHNWYEYKLISELGYHAHLCLGTPMGDLGRHTKIGPDGMPIVDHRTLVFVQ